MPQATILCTKCRTKKTVEAENKVAKNGRHYVSGKCPTCGKTITSFIKKTA